MTESHGKSRDWAAARYNVSTRTIDEMVRANKIPHLRLGTRVVFIEAVLEEWERQESFKNVHLDDDDPADYLAWINAQPRTRPRGRKRQLAPEDAIRAPVRRRRVRPVRPDES